MKNNFSQAKALDLHNEKPGLPADGWITVVLLVLCAMGVYCYGARAAAVAGVCGASCIAADIVCLILRKKRLHIHDLTALNTGLAVACLLPASVPYTIAAGICVFAVCICRQPFGGRGCEIICPAAAGYIFAELSFSAQVNFYPKPFEPLSLANTVTDPLYRAFSESVSGGVFSELELLVGSMPGSLGCTGAVTVMVCAAAVIFIGAYPRSVIIPELSVFLGYIFLFGSKSLAACAVDIFAIAFLSCGGHIPQKISGRIIFGIISGIFVIIISEISALRYPAVYACVIAAPFAFLADNFGKNKKAELSEDVSETSS